MMEAAHRLSSSVLLRRRIFSSTASSSTPWESTTASTGGSSRSRRLVSTTASSSTMPHLLMNPSSMRTKKTECSLQNSSTSIRWKSSAAPAMNAANGHQHQHYYHQNRGNDGDINSATIVFEDPVQDLLLPTDSEPRYWPNLPPMVQPRCAANDPTLLAQTELDDLARTIREDLIGVDHPVLNKAAAYFFDADSVDKKIRPMMIMLIARALSDATAAPSADSATTNNDSTSLFGTVHEWQRPDLPAAQRRLAELSEMIHAGTLFHDDVMDENKAPTRTSASGMAFGNKTAILAGDYFLARSSLSLARLRHTQVSEIMSTSIEHQARGEVMQIDTKTNNNVTTNGDSHDPIKQRLLYHLEKVFYKTGSLMAQTCRSAALLGDYSDHFVAASYRYGKHMGMAVQLVHDLEDNNGGSIQDAMGRPSVPVMLAALEDPGTWNPLIERQFEQAGDVDKAMALLQASNGGMERAQRLARAHAEMAVEAALEISSDNENNNNNNNSTVHHRDALVHLAYQVVSRTH